MVVHGGCCGCDSGGGSFERVKRKRKRKKKKRKKKKECLMKWERTRRTTHC